MRTLGTLFDWLVWDEDLVLHLYPDSDGDITGGIGHNFSANGLKPGLIASMADGNWRVIYKQGLSLDECLDIYNDDVVTVDAALTAYGLFSTTVTPRNAALANMMFNLGQTEFGMFTTFIPLVRAQSWDAAVADLKSNPRLFSGRLANRYIRIAQALLMDEWPVVP